MEPTDVLTLAQAFFQKHLEPGYGYYVLVFPYLRPGEDPSAQGSYNVLSSISDGETLAKLLEHCAAAVRKNLNAALVEAIREKEEVN